MLPYLTRLLVTLNPEEWPSERAVTISIYPHNTGRRPRDLRWTGSQQKYLVKPSPGETRKAGQVTV